MRHFPLATIPATAPRRTFLCDLLRNLAHCEDFYAMLTELDPEAAKRIGKFDSHAIMRAMLQHVAQRFPTVDIDEFLLETGELSLAELHSSGIPVEPQGFSFHDHSPALLTAFASVCNNWGYEAAEENEEFVRLVKSAWYRGRLPEDEGIERPRPPRSRRFTKPWDALPALVDYVAATTGFIWLDLNFDDYVQTTPPDWSVEQINGLAADWQKAKSMMDNINALTAYIEADPATRLPLLHHALRGEPEALRAISHPTPRRGKTLAEIFTQSTVV